MHRAVSVRKLERRGVVEHRPDCERIFQIPCVGRTRSDIRTRIHIACRLDVGYRESGKAWDCPRRSRNPSCLCQSRSQSRCARANSAPSRRSCRRRQCRYSAHRSRLGCDRHRSSRAYRRRRCSRRIPRLRSKFRVPHRHTKRRLSADTRVEPALIRSASELI